MLFRKNEKINIMNWIGWLRQGYGLSTLSWAVSVHMPWLLGLLHADNLVVLCVSQQVDCKTYKMKWKDTVINRHWKLV